MGPLELFQSEMGVGGLPSISLKKNFKMAYLLSKSPVTTKKDFKRVLSLGLTRHKYKENS